MHAIYHNFMLLPVLYPLVCKLLFPVNELLKVISNCVATVELHPFFSGISADFWTTSANFIIIPFCISLKCTFFFRLLN
jgi:hypothetical protein